MTDAHGTRSHQGKDTTVRRSRFTTSTRAGGAIAALALGMAGLVASPAAADTPPVAYAEARILAGSLLGANLDGIVALDPAVATNNGSQPTQVAADPLGATVLDAVTVDAPDGIHVDAGDGIDAGAVSQYAEARANGVSIAAAGAVGDDGAVGAGSLGSGPGGDLSIDLDSVLDQSASSVLTDLSLTLDAVAAEARANLSVASGDYRLAGAVLTMSSPAISDLTQKVSAALDEVDGSLSDLTDESGAIGIAVDRILDPVLRVIGSSADVSVAIDADVRGTVESMLRDVYGDGSVSFNLEDGTVSIDLAALSGGELNDLPPGTELIDGAVLGPVLASITSTVDTLADQIVDRVRAALNDATVTVTAGLDLLSSPGTTQTEQCHLIDVPILGDVLGGDGGLLGGDGGLLGGNGGLLGGSGGSGGGLLGGLLGKSVGHPALGKDIIGWTTDTVCELVETALPDLRSTVNVRIAGTVDDLTDGTAATATASVSLLGGTVAANVDTDLLVDAVGDGLASGLLGDGGAIDRLTTALQTGLVQPAQVGLLGDGGVADLLSKALSVKVNLQETATGPTGSMFTQTAVRVSVLDGAATLDVAAATVGPNVESVDPGCVVNCGPGGPGDPDCVTNCGPGTTPTGTGPGGLAMTGIGIAMLLQLVLGLLAAGAILAYAGYRKRHPLTPTGV